MTARTRDQAAARSLAVLTGAPYQSCLAALPVLRRLPRETESEELAVVLAGGEPFRHLTIGFSDRAQVEHAWNPPFASWLHPQADVLFKSANEQELLIFTSLVPPDTDLPETATLLVDDVCFTALPRNGVWRADSRAWRQACRAVLRTDADDWAVDVAARRADSSLVPPEESCDITFRHDLLRAAEPQDVVLGPGSRGCGCRSPTSTARQWPIPVRRTGASEGDEASPHLWARSRRWSCPMSCFMRGEPSRPWSPATTAAVCPTGVARTGERNSRAGTASDCRTRRSCGSVSLRTRRPTRRPVVREHRSSCRPPGERGPFVHHAEG